MNITKELFESMVREALNEVLAAGAEDTAQGGGVEGPANDDVSRPVNDDVSRILTKQDLERINTNPEFIKALKMIINHASFIPQGKTILTKLHRQLPQSIKGMK